MKATGEKNLHISNAPINVKPARGGGGGGGGGEGGGEWVSGTKKL